MKHEPSVIVRIRGGLGNQLFCYAAGRALAATNDALLKLDATSAYRDDKFGRNYLLDRFNICAEIALPCEAYEARFGSGDTSTLPCAVRSCPCDLVGIHMGGGHRASQERGS